MAAAPPLRDEQARAVAALLVRALPRLNAENRAKAVLADLRRTLPGPDWEALLGRALQKEHGIRPEAWLPPKPAAAGSGAAAPRKVLRVVPKPRPEPTGPPPRVGPTRSVARLSEDLEAVLRQAQMAEKAPAGMEKCPRCGAIVQPVRGGRIRTHDDPVRGARCDASKTLHAEHRES